jgi:nucleoside-diphosphate-sugar epimerase
MKVVVIGVTGFIGAAVARVFAEAGDEIVGLCRPGSAPSPGLLSPQCNWIVPIIADGRTKSRHFNQTRWSTFGR